MYYLLIINIEILLLEISAIFSFFCFYYIAVILMCDAFDYLFINQLDGISRILILFNGLS